MAAQFAEYTGVMSLWSDDRKAYVPWTYSRFEANIGTTIYPSEYHFLTRYISRKPSSDESVWYDLMAEACDAWKALSAAERTDVHEYTIDVLTRAIEEFTDYEDAAMHTTFDCYSPFVISELNKHVQVLMKKYKGIRQELSRQLEEEYGWGSYQITE